MLPKGGGGGRGVGARGENYRQGRQLRGKRGVKPTRRMQRNSGMALAGKKKKRSGSRLQVKDRKKTNQTGAKRKTIQKNQKQERHKVKKIIKEKREFICFPSCWIGCW